MNTFDEACNKGSRKLLWVLQPIKQFNAGAKKLWFFLIPISICPSEFLSVFPIKNTLIGLSDSRGN